jgi:hypothetical protein
MIVMGDNPPAPFTTFEETGFPRDFLRMVGRGAGGGRQGGWRGRPGRQGGLNRRRVGTGWCAI